MKLVFTILFVTTMASEIILFDFNKSSNISTWSIVDDVVMGGKSNGTFSLNSEGYGLFTGEISLKNNGGFSSVRHSFKKVDVGDATKVCIRLKGDGKSYQFRIKQDTEVAYSYTYPFTTSGDWETIEIPLEDMYPTYRGRTLRRPNFSHETIEEIVFLISNKKEESFQLLLDTITLK